MSESKLPTKEDIAELPRWAMVAFAARCARRVLPLYKHSWPDASEKHVRDLTRAVEIAEQFAAAATTKFDASADNAAANAAAAAADANGSAHDKSHAAAGAATHAASAADHAMDAANAAANVTYDPNSYTLLSDRFDIDVHDSYVANSAHAATAYAAATPTNDMIARDFQTVRERARSENWTATTPVPPNVFGPLWPDGPPVWWLEETGSDLPSEGAFDPVSPPAFVIAWDPAVVTPAQYARVVAALNKVVRVNGGEGLKRLEGKPFAATVPAEVPVP